MSERLTAWEGHNVDGTPRAVIAKRDGLFPDLLQPILKKLAEYEDKDEILSILNEGGGDDDGLC